MREDLLMVVYEDGKDIHGKQVDNPILMVSRKTKTNYEILKVFLTNEATEIYEKLTKID